MITRYCNWLTQGVLLALLIIFVFAIIYGIHNAIYTEHSLPYICSLEPYKMCEFPFADDARYYECKQIHLLKSVLDEIFCLKPEKISIKDYRIIYTITEYKDCYAILLPCQEDYNQFIKEFNKYTNLKETERKKRKEEENINKVLNDAYNAVG